MNSTLGAYSDGIPVRATSRAAEFMPQLDSLRAFAVMAVIVHHWLPHDWLINRTPNGAIGVTLFFVLSGFLITRILIKSRNQVLAGTMTRREAYQTFLIRRALRIFPLYFLILGFVYFFLPHASAIDEYPGYYLFYSYNILLNRTEDWADILSPFWSLAVEEQFYLVWPFVVMLTPRRLLLPMIGLSIGLGVTFRAYFLTQGEIQNILTPTCLDAFGIGALWAALPYERPVTGAFFRRALPAAAAISLAVFVFMLQLPDAHPLRIVFLRLVLSVLSLYAVAQAAEGIGGPVGRVLNQPSLLYMGKISYGLYVFHMLVSSHLANVMMGWMVRHIPRFPALGFWPYLAFSFVVLLALASLSWYFFEKPFNDLKRYFTYQK